MLTTKRYISGFLQVPSQPVEMPKSFTEEIEQQVDLFLGDAFKSVFYFFNVTLELFILFESFVGLSTQLGIFNIRGVFSRKGRRKYYFRTWNDIFQNWK